MGKNKNIKQTKQKQDTKLGESGESGSGESWGRGEYGPNSLSEILKELNKKVNIAPLLPGKGKAVECGLKRRAPY